MTSYEILINVLFCLFLFFALYKSTKIVFSLNEILIKAGDKVRVFEKRTGFQIDADFEVFDVCESGLVFRQGFSFLYLNNKDYVFKKVD